MNYEKLKEIAKTMSEEEFIKKYLKYQEDNYTEMHISDSIITCPCDILNAPFNLNIYDICQNLTTETDKKDYPSCLKCWQEFIDYLYQGTGISKNISNAKTIKEKEYHDKVLHHDINNIIESNKQTLKSKENTYTAEELIHEIKINNLKNNDKIQYQDPISHVKFTNTIESIQEESINFLIAFEPYILVKEGVVQKKKPLELIKKYFFGDTEIKEGMKLRIQNEDPYENKFEHICTIKKKNNKLYLKDDNSEAEFSIDDYSIKILEIIRK